MVAGIAPEQHGDRMRLFLQWKGMEDMPVLLDSYNVLQLRAVPITILVDEAGVIVARNPNEKRLEEFLAEPAAKVGSAPRAPRPRHRGPKDLSDLPLATREQSDGETEFHWGVAYRKAYDLAGDKARPEHFSNAVSYWRWALLRDPSNYIWRRRLQQYGPRLDKPYPFYDWVATARKELVARGAKPHPLVCEPTGAEIAHPKKADLPDEQIQHPDPTGKLFHDNRELFTYRATLVPHTMDPTKAARVFVSLTPDEFSKAKWNDEGGLSSVWIKVPKGWEVSRTSALLKPPEGAEEDKIEVLSRHVEFDLRRSGPAPAEPPKTFTLEFFTQVCHGKEGLCQFVRRDVRVELPKPLTLTLPPFLPKE